MTDRKPRCRMLGEFLNRCANEAVSTFGLCAHHLAEAAIEFGRITRLIDEGNVAVEAGGDGR